MNVQNLSLTDFGSKKVALGPNFQTAGNPAVVSFDVVWNGPITRRVSVPDGTQGNNYAGNYVENQATVNWSGKNLATGFSFTANPGTFATSAFDGGFAELGQERNGIFDPDPTASATPASTGTMIVAPPQGGSNSGLPSLGTPTGAAQPLPGSAGTTGSLSVAPAPMPFDTVLLARALAASPMAAATTGPTLAVLPYADTLAPSRTGEVQLVQSMAAPHRLTVGAELPQLVDQVLADLEGSAITITLHAGHDGAGVV
jgi:hypothetical protein